jgi:hypothetical protein
MIMDCDVGGIMPRGVKRVQSMAELTDLDSYGSKEGRMAELKYHSKLGWLSSGL